MQLIHFTKLVTSTSDFVLMHRWGPKKQMRSLCRRRARISTDTWNIHRFFSVLLWNRKGLSNHQLAAWRYASGAISDAQINLTWLLAVASEGHRSPIGLVLHLKLPGKCPGYPEASQMALNTYMRDTELSLCDSWPQQTSQHREQWPRTATFPVPQHPSSPFYCSAGCVAVMQYFTRTLKVLLSAQRTADRLDWPLNPNSQNLDFQTQSFSVQSQVHELMWQLSQELGYFSNAKLLSSPLSLTSKYISEPWHLE